MRKALRLSVAACALGGAVVSGALLSQDHPRSAQFTSMTKRTVDSESSDRIAPLRQPTRSAQFSNATPGRRTQAPTPTSSPAQTQSSVPTHPNSRGGVSPWSRPDQLGTKPARPSRAGSAGDRVTVSAQPTALTQPSGSTRRST